MALSMKSSEKTGVFGYVVQDKAGVVAIFPNWAEEEILSAMRAENYAKENTILETIEMSREEDEVTFKIRLSRMADEWRKKMKKNSVN